ncbi:NAD(P)H-dependent oxidoreductase [Novispirillum sp. DQ9]|uniref:NAD(P)H-dependent oxidoreductase n=1 Tax=Novispirillum sp. DQ9 TaxID=3398612 RepID=UPI003C7D8B64
MSPSPPRRILVVLGHPDPEPGHLCRALADAYAAGVREGGHGVETLDLSLLDIPLLRSQHAFEHAAAPDSLRAAQDALLAADHLVLVFPLWLGTMPALVKAFLEQVLRPGVAFEYLPGGATRLLLKGKSARVVVTMGMPAPVYRWWFLAHGIRGLERNILGFVGYRPVKETLFGLVKAATPQRRAKWLEEMRALGRRAG